MVGTACLPVQVTTLFGRIVTQPQRVARMLSGRVVQQLSGREMMLFEWSVKQLLVVETMPFERIGMCPP